MSAQPADGPDPTTVIDLPTRRSSDAVSPATVRVSTSGLWIVVQVDGEMDVQVVALAGELVGVDATRVVFDLHGVTFVDACGLGLMLNAQRRALEGAGSVRLVAPSRSVRRLLVLTGCSRVFRTFHSVHQATSTSVGPDEGEQERRF